jgi:hypothetical protein
VRERPAHRSLTVAARKETLLIHARSSSRLRLSEFTELIAKPQAVRIIRFPSMGTLVTN